MRKQMTKLLVSTRKEPRRNEKRMSEMEVHVEIIGVRPMLQTEDHERMNKFFQCLQIFTFCTRLVLYDN